jgi:hypothetical protein
VLVISLAVIGSPVDAATIFSSGLDGTHLVTLDTLTGLGTVIGPFGYGATYGTAFDPLGNLYTIVDSYGSAALATVNLATGAATPVGAGTGIFALMVMEFSASGTLYVGSWGDSNLYTLNTTTGAATLVGPSLAGMMDFAFNSAGVMYATNSAGLYTIDTTTGAPTFVAPISGTDGCNMGIAFDEADNLYGTSWCAGDSPLWKIDTTTGAATLVGLTGIAYLHGGDVTPIPEPITLLTVGSGLAALGALRRRRPAKS